MLKRLQRTTTVTTQGSRWLPVFVGGWLVVALSILFVALSTRFVQAQSPIRTLTIGSPAAVVVGDSVHVPLNYVLPAEKAPVSAFIFTVTWDPNCLDADIDNNGVDEVVFGAIVPSGYQKSVIYNETTHPGRLGIGIYNFNQDPPVLPSGELLRIKFTTVDDVNCAPTQGGLHTIPVTFGNQPSPSFATPLGADAIVHLFAGAVVANHPIAPNAPAFTAIDPVSGCDTFGNIAITPMPGVKYVHVESGTEYPYSTHPTPFTIANLEGSHKIRAVPIAPYIFEEDAETEWTANLGVHKICVVPNAPTFTPVGACSTYGSIKINPTTGVIYVHTNHVSGASNQYTTEVLLEGLHGTHTVTTTALPGFMITGTVTSWVNVNLGLFEACPGDQPVIPDEPIVVYITECGMTGSVTLPTTKSDQIVYSVNRPGATSGQVIVTATAKPGFFIPPAAQSTWTIELGDYLPCPGSIGNRVWNDTDGDGVQDAGEPGVEGVVVELYRVIGSTPGATPILTATTTVTGAYVFSNLSTVTGLEKYVVRYLLPPGYGFTSHNVGADDADSDAIPTTGYTALITLLEGQNNNNEDAGIYRAALSAAKYSVFDETVKGTPVHLEGKLIEIPYNSKNEDWVVTSRFVISNSGTVVLDVTALEDSVIGDIECAALDAPLAPGASVTCEASEPYLSVDNSNEADARASVTGKSNSTLETDHAEASDSAGYVCRGNELYGRWYYETNATFNGFTPGVDFLFKDAPASLVPATLKDIDLPVFLSRVGLPESEARAVFSNDGTFQLSNLDVGEAMTYTLRVGDDALTPLGYGPVGSSLRFDILAEHCTDLTFDIGYARSGGVMGGFVWYDVNSNGVKDEWFDANDDGEITQNNGADGSLDENGFVSMSVGDYEFFDINGNGEPDLPGELNECGLRSVGPTVELFDINDNLLGSTIAGNTGFYRFRTYVDPGTGEEAPLNLQTYYGLRLPAEDVNPLLATGAADMQNTGLCKTRPDLEPAAPGAIWSAGGDPAPNCGSSSVPVLVRRLADYEGGIALDADFGVVCRASGEPGMSLMWLPIIRINQ